MKEFLGGKALWLMTAVIGGATFTLSADEWKIFLGTVATIATGIATAAWKWHAGDMRKKRRMNGEQGKGETCKEDKES